MKAVAPASWLVSRARAWARTIGSLSTYTTRASGAASWATSWTLGLVGMPVPMSRNWRTPASSTRWRTARLRKARLAAAISRMFGMAWIISSPRARSAGKLSLPPSQ